MIDVVFLLLVFFMLASRFGTDFALPLRLAGTGGGYAGPPRVVDISPEGQRLNGVAVAAEGLVAALRPLMSAPTDTIVLRPRDGADLQTVVDLMQRLRAAGLTTLVLVDG